MPTTPEQFEEFKSKAEHRDIVNNKWERMTIQINELNKRVENLLYSFIDFISNLFYWSICCSYILFFF